MRYRILLLLAVIAALSATSRAQTGTNCSYGSYTLGGLNQNTPPCAQPPSTIVYTATYNEFCTTSQGANPTPGVLYYTGTSTVSATGQNSCAMLSRLACPPVMSFQETNGTTPSDYNRFYNRGYNYVITAVVGCTQESLNQDFKQCNGWPCVAKCFSGCGGSPIILDLNGKGFDLTDAQNGVKFDISGTGAPVQMGWIARGADNAFLALPGADGLVHNGMQLFGDFTPQPVSDHPNGFTALAAYDDPKNGGNGDGVIDSRDAIFSSLRLWIDTNHDGICQPEELHTLPSLGVNSISLTYKLSEKTDQYGNAFRYRGKVNPDDPDASHVDRTAYDVFFVILDSSGTAKSILNPDGNKCAVPALTNRGMLSTTGRL